MAIKLLENENKPNLPHSGVLARDLREQNDKSYLCCNFFKGMLCKVKFCSGHLVDVSIAILVKKMRFLSFFC